MNRSLTPDEKREALRVWPEMDVDNVRVTGPATAVYNCLAWTLGINSAWVWPWPSNVPATAADFDALYSQYRYYRARGGEVGAWGLSTRDMTHGSIALGTTPSQESKCGAWLRILHTQADLTGDFYGRVQYQYSDLEELPSENDGKRETFESMKSEFYQMQELSETEKTALDAAVAQLEGTSVQERFDDVYGRWKAMWQDPRLAFSSNPATRMWTIEFAELVSIGDAIIPLVIDRLRRHPDEEHFALQLYERLADPSLVVRRPLEDVQHLLGEQGRAAETVKRWAANIKQ